MANITIEAVPGKSFYKMVFADYAEGQGYDYRYIYPDKIDEVGKQFGKNVVNFEYEGHYMALSFDAVEGAMIVQSVLEDLPNDIDDLALKLASLKS